MGKRWSFRVLLCAMLLATVLVVPAGAHQGFKLAKYECWLTQIGYNSNFVLKMQSGGRYTWMWSDGTDKHFGKFERTGQNLRFTSGILKRRNFKGKHDAYVDSFDIHTHMIYLYKGRWVAWNSENVKYDCNNN